jgi:SAM-dependent methyltransferase
VTMSGRTTMSALQWQLARDAVRHYDEVLVPAYLGPAAEIVVSRAGLTTGESVLDVGCGTGAAARAARAAVGPQGRVVGVDVNRFMLEVARAGGDEVDYREGDARQLPLRDHSIDVVVCANTLQFVPERSRAAAQIARVLRPGGRVAVGTWATIDRNPYFNALAGSISRVMGPQVATALTSACTLGTPQELWGALVGGGLADVEVEQVTLDLRLGRLDTFVPKHLASTPMAAAFRGAGEEAVADVVRDVLAELGAAGRGDAKVPCRLLVAHGHAPA